MTIKKLANECDKRIRCDGCLYKEACRAFKRKMNKKCPGDIVRYIKENWEIECIR